MACSYPSNQGIVVGGGLAGMSAANTLLENGARVVLLDKSSFCGGNSTKATSGINGAGTRTQKQQGITDSAELFTQDTLKGGAKRPEVAKLMCVNSGPDVEWLMDVFNLDLSLVARLGGHSAPRTHRGKERFPGMTITYALIQMLEKIAERDATTARIITKARVYKLLTNSAKAVVGCVYEKGGIDFQEHGPVIFASGGFGADFTKDSLLAKYRPDLMHLPTTNGEHCTGDGIKMGEAVGAQSVDLEWVQIHPTGLVKPDDPDAKIKFLAAEALRGVGGLVLDANGKRFANELGRRDYVTGEMWKNKPPFRLCLNKKASDEIIWHCKHYTGRGVMKYYESGKALAADMGVDVSVLVKTHDEHHAAAKNTERDPDGGSWPAYPSGKSWDEASGKTGSGKKFFHNVITGSEVPTQQFYVAIITPVIHYCMGGLAIDTDSAVIDAKNKAIPGLYATGEVAGGVHGNNRLGGNSLLDCVVFGRVAGKACAKYILGKDVKVCTLKDLSGGGLTGEVAGSKLAGGSYEDKMNVSAKAGGAPGAGAAAAAAPGGGGGAGGLTLAEVAKHNTAQDCWVVVNDQVLDVTSFLKDHPGGELAIVTFAGKDATEEFNMIHPPDVIGKYAPDAVIGTIGGGGGGGGAAAAAAPALPPGMEYYTMEEVGKHTTNTDCWVVLHGRVLNVTSFLKDHPGGELAIVTFGGKDASEEFDMIHPPDVISKYAPDCVIGMIGTRTAVAAADVVSGVGTKSKLVTKDVGDKIANHTAWGDDNGHNWRIEAMDDNPGVLLIPFWAYLMATWALVKAILWEVCATIFTAKNFKITGDRVGLTRSAILLVLFIVIHAIGNLHVFLGPDDFNGYGYFYVRLYWTGFGLPANIVEEYVLLSILLHVLVGLKRSLDKMGTWKRDKSQSKMALSGLFLLTFMTIHLMQFRFGDTTDYMVRPPPLMINFEGILSLNLFWSFDTTVPAIPVRNIYKLEFDLFQDQGWCAFYILAVVVFMAHACWGWGNLVQNQQAFGIPKGHMTNVARIGYAIYFVIGACYISFPIYCQLADRKGPAVGADDQSACGLGLACDNVTLRFNPY